MAEQDEKTEQNTDGSNAELAPNHWFSEYNMPYTTFMLKNEAAERKENPERVVEDRHPLAQFIIDQETAVARDFIQGRISQEELDQFKAVSEDRIEDLQNGLQKEWEELGEEGMSLNMDAIVATKEFVDENGADLKTMAATSKVREVGMDDISLHLAADFLAMSVNTLDNIYEMLPPHIHDLIDVVEADTLDTAHALVDARADLSSAEENDIDGAREQLEKIEPVFEAEMDDAHENVDKDFDEFDAEIENLKEKAEAAQEHGELNPDATVEHAPYRVEDDYDVYDAIEDETGETTDVDDGGDVA